MTQEFIINVLLIVTIYLLALEVLVWTGKKIKEKIEHTMDEFECIGTVSFNDEDEE